jgi:hypothetical protein
MTSDDYPYWSREEWYETDEGFVSRDLVDELRRLYKERLNNKEDYPYEEKWNPNV